MHGLFSTKSDSRIFKKINYKNAWSDGHPCIAQSPKHCIFMEWNSPWTSSSKAHSFSSHSPRASGPCVFPNSATTLLSQPTSTYSQSWAATSPMRRRISCRVATNNGLTGGGNGCGGWADEYRLLSLVLAGRDAIEATRMCAAGAVKSKHMTIGCCVWCWRVLSVEK